MGFFRAFAAKHGIGGASMKHVSAGASMVREVGEGMLTGAALGAAHAMLPTGLDIDGKFPLDAAIAGLGILGGVGMAHEEFGQDLRNVGASASTIYSFRKMYAFAAAKKMADMSRPPELRIPGDRVQEQNVLMQKQQAGKSPALAAHGDFGQDPGQEDPVIAAARGL